MGKIEERGFVSFKKAWTDFFKGYVDFKGRTTRSGYWWVQLGMIIFGIIFFFVALLPIIKAVISTGFNVENFTDAQNDVWVKAVFSALVPIIIGAIISLAVVIPNAAMVVRRNRDVGLRGRGQLVLLILYILFSGFGATRMDLSSTTMASADISTYVNPLQGVFTAALFILSVLPTGVLATRSENPILAFFFKNKSFYDFNEQ